MKRNHNIPEYFDSKIRFQFQSHFRLKSQTSNRKLKQNNKNIQAKLSGWKLILKIVPLVRHKRRRAVPKM